MNIAGDIMQEIKKIFIYNKGIWVILSAVILWMGYLTMKPYTKPSKEYLYYLGNVSGKLNAHKESFLEEEAVQFANLHVEKESLTVWHIFYNFCNFTDYYRSSFFTFIYKRLCIFQALV